METHDITEEIQIISNLCHACLTYEKIVEDGDQKLIDKFIAAIRRYLVYRGISELDPGFADHWTDHVATVCRDYMDFDGVIDESHWEDLERNLVLMRRVDSMYKPSA